MTIFFMGVQVSIYLGNGLVWSRYQVINSLAPERCGSNFTNVFVKLNLGIDILSISCEIGLRRVPVNPINSLAPG